MKTISQRLKELGKSPRAASKPVAAYVSTVRSGRLLFVSGQVSRTADEVIAGLVGADISLSEGRRAAELAALNLLAQIELASGGALNSIHRIVRIGVFIASAPDFTQHSQVADGASELLVATFGEIGQHARTAIGVSSLPTGVSVEIDAIIEVGDQDERIN